MIERTLTLLDRPKARSWGWAGFACLLSFAAGTTFATKDALDGEGHWWQQYCHQQVKSHVQLQEKLDSQ